MAIYTRTGDDGTTALFGGKRVLKCEELVDVYGSIDELNSWIGLVGSKVESPWPGRQGRRKSKVFLEKIQSDLFMIGSTLAGWPARNASASVAGGKGNLADIGNRVGKMEKQIDAWEKELPELTNFILPGGSADAARVHLARSVCRRVERQAVALFSRQPSAISYQQENKDIMLKYLNRLSDLLFTLARIINKDANVEEIVWSGIPRPKR